MSSSRRSGRPPALLAALALALVLLFPGSTTTRAAVPPPAAQGVAQALATNGKHVVAVSVDGLNPTALTKLGRSRTPYLHKLVHDQGAGTVNARTQVEMTVTLPNHTSMVTGRAIHRSSDGHGVTWNDDTVQKTVDQAAGENVSSVFKRVHAAGGESAVFATKSKFWLYERTWPGSVDRNVIRVEDNTAVVRAMRSDLVNQRRDFYFLHIGLPDQLGHDHGFMSSRYLQGVERVDELLGSVMRTIRGDAALSSSTIMVLTSDHGGVPGTKAHGDATRWENYRVPFAFWGAGVPNEPLYAINPGRAWPDLRRVGFTGTQPIRNGEVANVALEILGLGPVPESRWNHRQDLRWR